MGNSHTKYPEPLAVVQRGHLNPKSLITREVSLSEVTGAIENMTDFKTVGFNVITTSS